MAATTFESNTLLLVNVADGKDSDTQYYVHICYTDDPEKGPLVDTPATYIGIYVGPEGTPPDDLDLYKWSKYGGESSYIDIRYSSTDGANKSLTLDDNDNPSGLTPGPWMGILITDNPKVLDPNWWPTENDIENVGIKISDYTWSLISQPGSDGIVYYLKYDYNNKAGNIYKFATGNSLYAYSPEKFKIIAHSRVGSYDSKMTSAELTCEIYYSYIDPSDPE
jgi:hypothetical protein